MLVPQSTFLASIQFSIVLKNVPHLFIGDPIDPMSENIMEELKELTDKKEYKKIIDKITEELKKELFAKQIRMGSSSCQC